MKAHRHASILIWLIVTAGVLIPCTHADPGDIIDVIFDWPCYKPTKVTFNYAYTHNHSLSDISTVGASLYKHSGGPTFFEFIAEDIDTYSFTIYLTYGNLTDQSVLIGLWSGSLSMRGFTVKGSARTFIIHVRLSLGEEPTYPSESEVAQAVVRQIQQALVNQTEENQRLRDEIAVATTTASIFGCIAAIASIAALAIGAWTFRRWRRVELSH